MTSLSEVPIEALGDSALLLNFGDRVDTQINAQVHMAARAIAAARLPGILELVPGFASLMVRHDPRVWNPANTEEPRAADPLASISRALRDALRTTPEADNAASKLLEIPVCYGGKYGLDLDALARHAQLDPAQVIERHCAAEYRVAMLGFAPGFAYLLGLDAALHMPRLAQPRTRVPAGSVAIGGAQTGVYPRELPGGWNLIGRTPLRMFDLSRAPPNRLRAGDRVRFRRIDVAEYAALCKKPSAP